MTQKLLHPIKKNNLRFTSKSASVIFPLIENSGKNMASCPRTGKFVLDRR
jgi:hypothetical protein